MDNKQDTPPPHAGHRQRLRERFVRSGLDGFQDYEFIELILTYAIPRRDVKPLAKSLMERFGGIRGILDASIGDLTACTGVGERTAVLIKLLKEGSAAYLKTRIRNKEFLASPQDVLNYCHYTLSGEKNEKFMVIYLSAKNELIDTGVLEEGTVSQTAVYPRKVMEAALRHRASALIFVHNHPSGDPTPSQADRLLTDVLVKAALSLDIVVHDHIIIGRDKHISWRENGWLPENTPSSARRCARDRERGKDGDFSPDLC